MPAARTINAPIEQNDLSRNRVSRALRFVQEQGLGEVLRQVRAYGLRGSLSFVGRNVRHIIADRIGGAGTKRKR